MRPIPLRNPWIERRRKFLMAFGLIIIAVASTRPNSPTGVAIALSTIPFLFLAFVSLRWWWHRKFGGSKFMVLISWMLMLTIGLIVLTIVEMLSPYIGQHFN
jgi:phosphotransferase system  glucose/maltose/N-acetylglucosamine-specific IIC component